MKTAEQRLAEECIAKAKMLLGSGWNHVSEDIRWGLVAANILAIMDAQDESIESGRVMTRTRMIMHLAGDMLAK